jgi:hypothetical protein
MIKRAAAAAPFTGAIAKKQVLQAFPAATACVLALDRQNSRKATALVSMHLLLRLILMATSTQGAAVAVTAAAAAAHAVTGDDVLDIAWYTLI